MDVVQNNEARGPVNLTKQDPVLGPVTSASRPLICRYSWCASPLESFNLNTPNGVSGISSRAALLFTA